MGDFVQLNLSMNAYLFGSLVLMALWTLTLVALVVTGRKSQLPEFWWGSLIGMGFAVTEPLFVPEYWDPPSILKLGRWDFESFIFCFAVAGMAGVLTELPFYKRAFVKLDFALWRALTWVVALIPPIAGAPKTERRAPAARLVWRDQARIENMLLVTFFVGMFGATAHFGINIIYDAAFVCVASAGMIAWRRPSLRWQILGGGVAFTLIYTVVLLVSGQVYPDFYEHWNIEDLSGIWLLGAPLEEYLFAFTFGMVWAPLYEAWMESRS